MDITTSFETKFKGMTLDFFAYGKVHIRNKKYNDHFVISRPKATAKNIILGKIYVEHHGNQTCENVTTGEKCVLTFFKKNKKVKTRLDYHDVDGYVEDAQGEKKYIIWGKWNERLMMQKADESEEPFSIFQIKSFPIDTEH
jgi:hypothetical protein